jgi:hypothetical protein
LDVAGYAVVSFGVVPAAVWIETADGAACRLAPDDVI